MGERNEEGPGIGQEGSKGLVRGAWCSVRQAGSEVATSAGQQARNLVSLVKGLNALFPEQPVWLLGTYYGVVDKEQQRHIFLPEMLETFHRDFSSRIWCTYRKNFPPLGGTMLTSDVGWGCTLRSGQMLLAEALSRHLLGRCWVRDPLCPDPRMLDLLNMLADHPSAPISVHKLCSAGADYGVVPGKWLGPWVLCKTLAGLGSRQPLHGLDIHVVYDLSGGGAPALDVQLLRTKLPPPPDPQPALPPSSTAEPGGQSQTSQQAPPWGTSGMEHTSGAAQRAGGEGQAHEAGSLAQQQQPASASQQAEDRQPSELGTQGSGARSERGEEAALCPSSTGREGGGSVPDASGHPTREEHPSQAMGSVSSPSQVQGTTDQQPQQQQQEQQQQHQEQEQQQPPSCSHPGLLLLVPLTLGMDKANPLYYPQLQEVMTFPQTVGIIGGRPSSSLYFLGFQGQHLLYLDPHYVQSSAPIPEASSTYFCERVQLMPISSMDPSIAMGFYCQHAGDLEDLSSRLSRLAATHRAAPLMTVDYLGASSRQASDAQMLDSRQGGGDTECAEWEVL